MSWGQGCRYSPSIQTVTNLIGFFIYLYIYYLHTNERFLVVISFFGHYFRCTKYGTDRQASHRLTNFFRMTQVISLLSECTTAADGGQFFFGCCYDLLWYLSIGIEILDWGRFSSWSSEFGAPHCIMAHKCEIWFLFPLFVVVVDSYYYMKSTSLLTMRMKQKNSKKS